MKGEEEGSGTGLKMLADGGNDEATEGFVMFGTAIREGGMPFMKPFVVLDGITEIGIGFCRGLFDELESLTLGIGNGVRITVLRAV